MEKLTGAQTALEKAVQKIINKNDDPTGYAEDILQHGCQSGIVSEMVYYCDTTKFYAKHKKEIQTMLRELLSDCGCIAAELFRDKWDSEDMFCEEQHNQNLLAWFGFEETTRELAERNGIEV